MSRCMNMVLGVVSFLVLGFGGCSQSSSPDGADGPEAEDCTPPFMVTVTDSIQPTFDWQPPCKVCRIRVEATDTGRERWSRQDSTNYLAPPVSYGSHDPQEQTPPVAILYAGSQYLVSLHRIIDSDTTLVGTAQFTPSPAISMQQALDTILSEVVAADSTSSLVYALPGILPMDTAITTSDPNTTEFDWWENSWFFFVDRNPETPWPHSCTLVFFALDSSFYQDYDWSWPPDVLEDMEQLYPERKSIN